MKRLATLMVLVALFLFAGTPYADDKGDVDRQHKIHSKKDKASKHSKKVHEKKHQDSDDDDRDDHDRDDDDDDNIAFVNSVNVYGPKKFVRTKGKPNRFTESFRALPQIALIVIENGQNTSKKNKDAIKSAKININGKEVLESDDFEEKEYILKEYVRLKENNTISIKLKSKPGNYLTIRVIQDVPPPTINLTAIPTGVHFGETSTLSWDSANADAVTIEPNIGNSPVNGSTTVTISQTTTYTATATGLGGATSVQATIAYINTQPVAYPQSVIIDEDIALPITLTGADVDSDPFTYSIVSLPTNGLLSGITPNLSYTPDQDFHGSDSFSFLVNDGKEDSLLATVNVRVNPANDIPIADPLTVTINEDDPVSIGLSGSDVDGDTLTYQVAAPPTNGILIGVEPNLTYTPNLDFNGSDSFTFKANDGLADSSPTTVSINITPVNDAPVSKAGQDQTIFRLDTVNLDAGGSSDIDGDNLMYQWSFVSTPNESQAALTGSTLRAPSFVPDVAGIYELQVVVSDSLLTSTDNVIITVNPIQVTVPTLTGLTQFEAVALIENTGLVVGTITDSYSDVYPTTYVMGQSIVTGGVVEENTMIDFVVSRGPQFTGPAISFWASPENIQQSESVILSWDSSDATSLHIDNGIGVVAVNGSIEIFPEHTSTYTLTATGATGSSSKAVTIFVNGAPTPQPGGSFGSYYDDLTPADATIQQYAPNRFALITGLVSDLSGTPIPDVVITIKDHPEYGTAYTDVSGHFSIPVEGGGIMTIVYDKTGLFSAYRQTYVPWNDIVVAKKIQMIGKDPIAAEITFDSNPNTVFIHESKTVVDEFGSRSATIIMQGDNQAYAVDKEDVIIHELPTINVRATEFITPESMTSDLPPNYTYAYNVDISVDGIKRVKFDKPVTVWVDNFLDFKVGTIASVSYYDHDQGKWVASENGVVVMLLDTNGDGTIDALDSNNDGNPDDLDGDTSFKDEVVGLYNSSRYTSGTTFLRFSTTHFSSYSAAYVIICQPCRSSTSPNAENPPWVEDQEDDEDENPDDCQESDSYIQRRNRIYHEDIAILGTGLKLHYASNRSIGYKTIIQVPVSGTTAPQRLKEITVEVTVAGKTYEQKLPPLPNQNAEFIWDGIDYLGRRVFESTTAHIKVGFVYDPLFPAAGEEIVWKKHKLTINPTYRHDSIGEGWTLSSHHRISPSNPSVLFKGNGAINENYTRQLITTVAGDGLYGYKGENVSATFGGAAYPTDVVADNAGNFYLSDNEFRVRKVDQNGIISTLAGNGGYGYSGDNGPANEARIALPLDIDIDNNGNVYIATADRRVRKVDTNGIITTVAGNGTYGYSGDNLLATETGISPTAIATDNFGNLFIADRSGSQIRKVDTNGVITTIAGNGTYGFSGDNGPAIDASISEVSAGIAVDNVGNLFFADTFNYRIRKIDTNGIITTVAGNGTYGYSGENIPAIESNLSGPSGLALDEVGNLFFAETWGHRIRKVDTSGIITTVSGTGSYGYSGDNGPPSGAMLYYPENIDVDSAGNLFIADKYNHRIRKVAPSVKILNKIMNNPDGISFADVNGLGHIMSKSGRHKSTIDLNTGVLLREFGYDQNGLLTSITDQFANQVTINRDGNGVPISIQSPEGLTTTLQIDANNHLEEVTFPDNTYYEFEYTPDGLMKIEKDPAGNSFEHIYNTTGRLINVLDLEGGNRDYQKTVLPNGDILTESHSAEGNYTSFLDYTDSTGEFTSRVIDSSGAERFYNRSSDGLTTTDSLPCGMELYYEYGIDTEYKLKVLKQLSKTTPSGLSQTTLIDRTYQDTNLDEVPDLISNTIVSNGKTWTIVKDALQSISATTSPEGRVVTSHYDSATLVTTNLSISGLLPTTYGYDTKGRNTSISTGTRETSFSYNTQGFLDSVTDPGNNTTSYSYDQVGRVAGITRPDTTTVGFSYDNNGNMTMLTNPSADNHVFGYNSVNYKTLHQTPLGDSYSYYYDKDRRLTQINYPSGFQINNLYTNGLLTQTQTPEGNIGYSYLCNSKVGTITKGTDSVTYGYDGSFLTSVTTAGALAQSLSFTYNNDFQPVFFTYAGATESLGYDNDGLLTGVGRFTITRDAQNGLPTAITATGWASDRTFNGYGELDSEAFKANTTSYASWNVIRDDNGRIVSKSETVNGVTSDYAYGYDSMGRLLTVHLNGTLVEEYQYGANGTRSYEMNSLKGIAGRSYAYSIEDHLMSAGGVTYGFDPDGFLVSKTEGANVTSYNYSSRGELLEVILPDTRVLEYKYDPLGRRIAKLVNGVLVEKYLWAGLTQLLAVYDSSDNLLVRFEYADGRMPYVMVSGGNTFYLSYDQVGSLRTVADASGAVLKEVVYDSFGSVISDSDPAFVVPFGFAGGLYDADTRLVKFGYRDYDPEIGRWIAKDPIGFAGGDIDLYGYVQNNPVNFIDPDGLAPNWAGPTGAFLTALGGTIVIYPHPYPKVAGWALGGIGSAMLLWDAATTPGEYFDTTKKKLAPLDEELQKMQKELENDECKK